MERRFELRKEALLAECEVSSEVFRGAVERLAKFVEPFAELLGQPAQRRHTTEYLSGLISDLKRKNVESIAYRHDQDRKSLQHFMGSAEWDHQPLMAELARQVGEELGEEDGVIVFDAQFTPALAEQLLADTRSQTDTPGDGDSLTESGDRDPRRPPSAVLEVRHHHALVHLVEHDRRVADEATPSEQPVARAGVDVLPRRTHRRPIGAADRRDHDGGAGARGHEVERVATRVVLVVGHEQFVAGCERQRTQDGVHAGRRRYAHARRAAARAAGS